MNVLRGIINKKRGLKFIEDNLKVLMLHNFREMEFDIYKEPEFELAFEDFKREAYSIKGFNFYVHNVYMYSNDFGIYIVSEIKHELLPRKYKFSMRLSMQLRR